MEAGDHYLLALKLKKNGQNYYIDVSFRVLIHYLQELVRTLWGIHNTSFRLKEIK